MANNFQMAVRGGIMIVTMVTIPLLAIFGKQIPELIQGIYRGNTKTDEWQTRPTQPVAATGSNATANQLAVHQPRGEMAPAFQPSSAGSLNPANSPAPKFEPPPLATNAFQAAQPLPLSPMINNTNHSNTLNPARSNNLGQALPPSTLRDSAVSPVANHAASADLNSAAFQQGQQRLRELGVHFFRLETTGEALERYRAECELRTAANAPAMKFSSINADPLTALNDIIGQVERTRGGRGTELQAQRGMLR
jgi:hypothetical protein